MSQPDSFLLAVTGKSGVFSFAAHNHAVLANQWSADLALNPADLAHSRVALTIPVSALIIDSHEARGKAGLGSGPSAKDVATIQQRMLGPEVLDARRYPQIRFVSTAVESAGADRLRITGTFQMHGQSQQVTIPARYRQLASGGYEFSGNFMVRQTDFGIKPETVGGGTVKVKNEVTIRFQVTVVPQS